MEPQTHEEMEAFNGKATVYEIVNKVTKEIFPVTKLETGDVDDDQDNDFIVHKEDGEEVIFTNPNYENEFFVVREVGSNLSPDGVTVVLE